MNKSTTLRAASSWIVLMSALALAGCSKDEPAGPPPSKPKVGVVTLQTQPVTLTTELPGRVAAHRIAEVRPQVSGIVQKRLFKEGGEVKAGEQLYQIDPALYQAEVSSRRAALARAEAQLKSASLLAQRYRPLAESRAVSRQTFDDAVSSQAQAQADVATAKAALDTAQINLVYTKVLAPIPGLIGRSNVTEGALVTANQANAMATVQQIDPIYVDVTQSSVQLLELQDAFADGQLQRAEGDKGAAVSLVLEDGSNYAQQGVLQFSEVTVDPGTGSVLLRAEFTNPDRRLLPGMFVRARLTSGVAENGLLVPQRGVTRNQRGLPTALVVTPENKVELRNIKTAQAIGENWLVTEGLAAGDRVIVEGLQKVRPGAEVEILPPKEAAAANAKQDPKAGGQAAPAANAQQDAKSGAQPSGASNGQGQ